MEYNKQIKVHNNKHNYDLFGYDDTKRFHWDIITLCNYNCEYCYSRANEQQWNKITSKKQVDIIIEKLKQISDPLEIIVLGGEPTLHPSYFYILDQLWDISGLRVLGNISNSTFKDRSNFLDKHLKYINKFHFNITFHPSEIKDFEEFKDTILEIKTKGFKININVMLIDEKYNDVTIDLLKFLKLHDFRYYFNVIFSHGAVEYANTSNGYREWIKILTKEFGAEKELVYYLDDKVQGTFNDADVYLENLSDFEGWRCKNNNYHIPVNETDFKKFCNWKTITPEEINNDPLYMICPLKQCVCQGKLTNEKIKNAIQ